MSWSHRAESQAFRRRVAELWARGGEALAGALAERLAQRPDCPIANYLAGCQCIDQGLPATGVRRLMTAYRRDWRLESAALLVFAGLNLVSRPSQPLLRVVLDTFEEFRRPEFDRQPAERRLLDCLCTPLEATAGASPLSLKLWRLPIPTLREQIRAAVQARESGAYSALVAPT